MGINGEVKMHETNKYYCQAADVYLTFLKEKKLKPLPKSEEVIKNFLKELKNGYGNNKPKAQGTVKAKLVAIKNLYVLNGITDLDFDSIYKYIPELFATSTQQVR